MTHKLIKRLPKDPGPAAWNSILSPAKRYPTLDQDMTADWVIVGAGFTGLSAARRLAQLLPSDESIAVVEAGQLANGPAGRNSGFMIDLPHELNSDTYAGSHDQDLQQILLNRHAINFAEETAQEYGMHPQVFSRSGKITGAATTKGMEHIRSYCEHLKAIGESFTLKNAAEMQAITGSSFYQQGIATTGGAMIQPAAYIRELAKGISTRVQIFENTPVTAIDSGNPHQLTTPKAKITAKNIILCVNGHIQSFGYYPKQLLHVFTFASITRKLTANEVKTLGGQKDWGILPADPMGTTVRRISNYDGSGDRIIIRNLATLNQSLEAPQADMRRAAKMQDESYVNRFPMLKDVNMEYRWGGRLCLSWNSAPAFGEIENRVWSACCQNGLGTVKGTLSGMMVAEQAVLGKSDYLDLFMKHAQPAKLPPEPFLSLGANMTMRWKQWLAGKEL